jgi:hypothetical protein
MWYRSFSGHTISELNRFVVEKSVEADKAPSQ